MLVVTQPRASLHIHSTPSCNTIRPESSPTSTRTIFILCTSLQVKRMYPPPCDFPAALIKDVGLHPTEYGWFPSAVELERFVAV